MFFSQGESAASPFVGGADRAAKSASGEQGDVRMPAEFRIAFYP
jgi:hypothetical protein